MSIFAKNACKFSKPKKKNASKSRILFYNYILGYGMANITEHEHDCKLLLGKAHHNVHKFLDQYAGHFPVGRFFEYHRTFLHNEYGISLVQTLFGDESETAAIIHIVRDWHEMPLGEMKLDWVMGKLGKALIHFHSLDQFDPRLDPGIMAAWKGKGLCTLAFGE